MELVMPTNDLKFNLLLIYKNDGTVDELPLDRNYTDIEIYALFNSESPTIKLANGSIVMINKNSQSVSRYEITEA